MAKGKKKSRGFWCVVTKGGSKKSCFRKKTAAKKARKRLGGRVVRRAHGKGKKK